MDADRHRPASAAQQPDQPDLVDGGPVVYTLVNDTPACAGLCVHRAGAVILGSVALTPMSPDQAKRAFGTLAWGGQRRLLGEAAAVAHVLAAIAKPSTRPWLAIAARLPAEAAPLLHHRAVRPALMAAGGAGVLHRHPPLGDHRRAAVPPRP